MDEELKKSSEERTASHERLLAAKQKFIDDIKESTEQLQTQASLDSITESLEQLGPLLEASFKAKKAAALAARPKGFIELSEFSTTYLVAVSSIISLTKGDGEITVVTFAGTVGKQGDTLHANESYEELVARLKAAS